MMPVALQVFYIVLAIVVLGWAGWVTRLVLKHGNTLAAIEERCNSRGDWLEELNKTAKVTARNVVRLGAAMNVGDLESPD